VDSQNFLGKLARFFVTLGLKILRLFRPKVLFEADIIKGDVNYKSRFLQIDDIY